MNITTTIINDLARTMADRGLTRIAYRVGNESVVLDCSANPEPPWEEPEPIVERKPSKLDGIVKRLTSTEKDSDDDDAA
jgi:hypothetical protein